MPPVPKPQRVKDKGVIRSVRKPYCEWCGKAGKTEVHHIKSRGAGNPDHKYNLVALCWHCHHELAHNGIITARQLFRLVAAREGVDYDTVRETVRELKT